MTALSSAKEFSGRALMRPSLLLLRRQFLLIRRKYTWTLWKNQIYKCTHNVLGSRCPSPSGIWRFVQSARAERRVAPVRHSTGNSAASVLNTCRQDIVQQGRPRLGRTAINDGLLGGQRSASNLEYFAVFLQTCFRNSPGELLFRRPYKAALSVHHCRAKYFEQVCRCHCLKVLLGSVVIKGGAVASLQLAAIVVSTPLLDLYVSERSAEVIERCTIN